MGSKATNPRGRGQKNSETYLCDVSLLFILLVMELAVLRAVRSKYQATEMDGNKHTGQMRGFQILAARCLLAWYIINWYCLRAPVSFAQS